MTKSFEYSDQFTPARMIQLMRENKITQSDELLIYAINSQVKHYSDGTGMGCFAGTAYLAEATGTHEKYVQSRLTALENMGVLIRIKYRGKRYLEIEWSRTAEERNALKGEYGKLLREAHAKLVKSLKKPKREGKENLTEGKENLTEGNENLTSGSKENLTYNYTVLEGIGNTLVGDPATPRPAASSRRSPSVSESSEPTTKHTTSRKTTQPSPNGQSQGSKKRHLPEGTVTANQTNNTREGLLSLPKGNNGPQQVAGKLKELLIRHRQLDSRAKPEKWAAIIKRGLYPDWDTDHLLSLLDWYDNHFDDDYIPYVRCAADLVKKAFNLQRAVERHRKMMGNDQTDSSEDGSSEEDIRAWYEENGWDYVAYLRGAGRHEEADAVAREGMASCE